MNIIIKLNNKGSYNHIKANIGYDKEIEYLLNYEKANIHHASLAVHYFSLLLVLKQLNKLNYIGIVNIFTTSDLMIGQLLGNRKVKDKKNRYKRFYQIAKEEMDKMPIKFNFHKLKKKKNGKQKHSI